MYQIDFQSPIHVHFMGIGGISMSGLAEILLNEGFRVSGSDMRASDITAMLEKLGATVQIGQRAANITSDIDLVVYTAAIHADNPEFAEAKAKNLPMLTRAQLLGQIMDNYDYSVSVAGTHGKTTTTSMLSHIFMSAKLDPTISIGGMLDSIGGNIRVGNSEYFITEACEYTNSYHEFKSQVSIILNVDADHLDFFSGIDEIIESFATFAKKTRPSGTVVVNADMDCLPRIVKDLDRKVLTFGLSSSRFNYTAKDITYDSKGCGQYILVENGKETVPIHLSVTGEHNVMNSLGAIAAARSLGVEFPAIQAGLLACGGAKRRFEWKGTYKGITIMDDYAHHPTEIKATLQAAERTEHKALWCVFQPHTYTRTKALLSEFAEALHTADHVILTKIYAAREKDTGEVSAADIADILEHTYHTPVVYLPDFEQVKDYIKNNCEKNDLLITMGAGDVVTIGEDLLKE